MHPDCATARLKLWGATDNEAASALRKVRDVGDFIVWGMTEGTKYLKYRWGEKDAWIEAIPPYLRMKRIELAENKMTLEVDKLMAFHSRDDKTFLGMSPQHSSNSEGQLWVREAARFLRSKFPDGVTAFMLGVIDLPDLAKLCYGGDMLAAKHEMQVAQKALKEWYYDG